MARPRTGASLLALLLLVGACSSGAEDAVSDAPPARAADLDALVAAYDELHPEPPDLTAAVARLRERAGGLSEEQWLVELMRLTAGRDRDGHTGVFPLAQPELEIWPLQLYAFTDGWRVVAAQPPYEHLVGGAVTAVGGVPVEEAAARSGPLVSHDNAATTLARVPQLLVVPAVLTGLGLDPELTVEGEVVAPEPVSTAEYASWSGSFSPLVVPRLPPVPAVGLELAVRDDAVVVGYHAVQRGSGATSVRSVADELRRLRTEGRVDRVVVDVRRNPGGENGSYPPLLAALKELDDDRPGSVRVLLGRGTFSAATNFVAELLAGTQAVAVGEDMGGSPNLWGDAEERTLPGSGLTLHVATRWWTLGGEDPRTTLGPDVPVPVTSADWSAGRDPALEAALGG